MLLVTVSRGAGLEKKGQLIPRLHPSYETTLRILNERPTSLLDIRSDRVERTVAYMFSSYRDLHTELLNLGVESQCPFPPTLTKSSLGMELSESDLQTRCSLLSDWMEDMLLGYSALPNLAARLSLLSFLKLEAHIDRELLERMSVAVTVTGTGPTTVQATGNIEVGVSQGGETDDISKIVALLEAGKVLASQQMVSSMLSKAGRGGGAGGGGITRALSVTNVALKVKRDEGEGADGKNQDIDVNSDEGSAGGSDGEADKEEVDQKVGSSNGKGASLFKSIALFAMGNKSKGQKVPQDPDDEPASDSDDEGKKNSSQASKSQSGRGKYHSALSVASASEMGQTENAQTGHSLLSLSVLDATIIRDNLSIKVEKGRLVSDDKKSKKRQTYLTTIAVAGSEKDYPPCFKQGVFDKYRSLASTLFSFSVSDNRSSRYVISAPFPRTYKRSAMGIALTQEQLNDRTQRLHNWVVALLEIFPTLPKEAQEEIYSFFNIETDGTEAQGTAISTILSPNWMVTDEVARSLVRDPILKLPVDAISTAEPKSPGATRTSAGVLSFIDIGGEGAGPTSCCTVS